MKLSDNNSRSDTCITHLGVTYSITHFAHQSETPLETCPYCAGTGQLYTRKCRNCNGRGLKVNVKPEIGRKAGR
jgi:DnaJ-class molecular chaperone